MQPPMPQAGKRGTGWSRDVDAQVICKGKLMPSSRLPEPEIAEDLAVAVSNCHAATIAPPKKRYSLKLPHRRRSSPIHEFSSLTIVAGRRRRWNKDRGIEHAGSAQPVRLSARMMKPNYLLSQPVVRPAQLPVRSMTTTTVSIGADCRRSCRTPALAVRRPAWWRQRR